MKTRDKVFGGLAALSVLAVSMLIASIQSMSSWQASVPAMTLDEIRNLNSSNARRSSDGIVTTDELRDAETATPQLPKNGRFAAQPTEEQLQKHFCPAGPNLETKDSSGQYLSRAMITALYRMWPNGRLRSVPGNIAGHWQDSGDFDLVRAYLREAVRIEPLESLRRHYCGMLAWLEDDPQVAVALIEQSLSGPPDGSSNRGVAAAAQNALQLAVATGSDDIAEYYFQRYHDSWSAWLEEENLVVPEIQTWLNERLN